MMLVPRILVLIVIAGTKLLVFGADEYTVKTTETCYNNGDTAVIEVDYTDSNTVDFLQWKFSEMTIPADTLIIVASLCQTSAGQDAAFPTARMTYSCDNTNEDYTITISQFNENTDAGVWEVALSTNGAYTSYQSVTLSTCTNAATTPTTTTTSTTTTPTTTTTTPTTTTTTTTPTTTTTTPTTTTTTTPTTTTTTPTTTTTTPTTTTTTPTTTTTTPTTTTTTPTTTTTVVIIVCVVIFILVLVVASVILWWLLKEGKSHSGNLRHNEKRHPTPHKTQSHFYPGVQQPLHNNVSRMNGSQYGHGQEGKLKLNPVYNRATNAPTYHGHHHYYQDRAGRMEQYPPTMAADRYPATVYVGAQPRVTDNNGLYPVPTVHPGYARAHYRSNEWPINGSTLVRNRENYVVGDYSRNWY